MDRSEYHAVVHILDGDFFYTLLCLRLRNQHPVIAVLVLMRFDGRAEAVGRDDMRVRCLGLQPLYRGRSRERVNTMTKERHVTGNRICQQDRSKISRSFISALFVFSCFHMIQSSRLSASALRCPERRMTTRSTTLWAAHGPRCLLRIPFCRPHHLDTRPRTRAFDAEEPLLDHSVPSKTILVPSWIKLRMAASAGCSSLSVVVLLTHIYPPWTRHLL